MQACMVLSLSKTFSLAIVIYTADCRQPLLSPTTPASLGSVATGEQYNVSSSTWVALNSVERIYLSYVCCKSLMHMIKNTAEFSVQL